MLWAGNYAVDWKRGKGKTNLVLIKQIGLINVFMPIEVPKLTERRITIL